MNEDVRIHFALIANHLRDCHHQLQEQMRTKRRWEFVETPQGGMAVSLMPLLSIVLLLERLATPEAPAVFPSDDFGALAPDG